MLLCPVLQQAKDRPIVSAQLAVAQTRAASLVLPSEVLISLLQPCCFDIIDN